jgi:hypothetical protein
MTCGHVRIEPGEAVLDLLLGQVLENGDRLHMQALGICRVILGRLNPDHFQGNPAQPGHGELLFHLHRRWKDHGLQLGRAREVVPPG